MKKRVMSLILAMSIASSMLHATVYAEGVQVSSEQGPEEQKTEELAAQEQGPEEQEAERTDRENLNSEEQGGEAFQDLVIQTESSTEFQDEGVRALNSNASQDVPTEEEAYAAMIALKDEYNEGRPWTNANGYAWNGGIYSAGYGCAGFAFLLSDAAFGSLPARQIWDVEFEDIHVGDILRVNGNSHSVIVLRVFSDSVEIAEGNYNSSIHWGRILNAEAVEAADYCMTRYPIGYFNDVLQITLDYNQSSGERQVLYKKPGKQIELPEIGSTDPFHEFAGWALSPDADEPVYGIGDYYTDDVETTLYAVWKEKDLSAYPAFSNDLPETKHVVISSDRDVYYTFCPEKTGIYVIESSNIVLGDPVVELLDKNGTCIAKADDNGDTLNFKLSKKLYAGETYLFHPYVYGLSGGEYDITLTMEKTDTSDTISTNLPQKLNLEVTYEDPVRIMYFTPDKTGTYLFESTGNHDTVIHLYNDDTLIASNDDYNGGFNFHLEVMLEKDVTYRLEMNFYRREDGEFGLYVAELENTDVTPAAQMVGYNISIFNGGIIRLNMYVLAEDSAAADLYAGSSFADEMDDQDFRKGAVISSLPILDEGDEGKIYQMSQYLNSGELTRPVSFSIQNAENEIIESETLSAVDILYAYLDPSFEQINPDLSEEQLEYMRSVVIAVLNYGSASQQYFGTWYDQESGFANDWLSDAEKVIAELTDEDLIADNTNYKESPFLDELSGFSYVGSSLLMKEQVYIRQYFIPEDGIDVNGYLFEATWNDWEGYPVSCTTGMKGEYMYVEYPAHMNEPTEVITVKISGDNKVQQYQYSLMNYIGKVVSSSANTELIRLVSAMYWYSKVVE